MVDSGARPEVGSFLVPRARVLVGPGASRAPRTVAKPLGRSTHPRLRSSGAPRRRRPHREATMDVLYPRCAGLDIHRDTIVACVRLAEAGGVVRFVETVGTTTTELERLSQWLTGHGVTCIAMEATGVYWKPVWAVLAGDFERVLANAHHVKAVPGRKTDVNDATWLADLLAHGLIRPSFVPTMPEQALRDLTRARKQLTREKASHVQPTRPFRPPTSSSARCSRTSWAKADGSCLRRSQPANVIPSGLPAWSGPRSGPPMPRWSRPCAAGWRPSAPAFAVIPRPSGRPRCRDCSHRP